MRFYAISAVFHVALFSAIAFSNRSNFKPMPRTEIYRVNVSFAPMPQPAVLGIPGGVPGGKPGGGPGPAAGTGDGTGKAETGAKKIQEKGAPSEGSTGKGTVAKDGVPQGKGGTKSGGTKDGGGRLGLPDGLPDISPQIYTGSGRGFNYSYYLNILLAKIGKNWNNPFKNEQLLMKAIIYFEVDKEGRITNVRLEEDSGNDVYDETAMRAVTTAPQLPPLPQELSSTNDYLKVHLEFLSGQ